MFMSNRFPIEFFQELVKKQMMRDEFGDPDTTLVDGDETEDMNSLEDTVPDRVVTLKF
tara:strand:+ start:768 stop:941 length:174 start_codon:yes stop_codon:yes gene_type:complete